MNKENTTINDYIENAQPLLEKEPELILADLYLANFYRKIEEKTIKPRTPEGKELCQKVINFFREKKRSGKIELFYHNVARYDVSWLDSIGEKFIKIYGALAIAFALQVHLVDVFIQDEGERQHKKRIERLKKYILS